MAPPRDSLRFALLGLALGAGAPLGWLGVRLLGGHGPVQLEVRGHLALYLYLLLATGIAFAGFGLILGRMSERLAALNAALARRALTDPLSGLHNRAYFDERLAEELAVSHRAGTPLSLVYFDLDHFKEINDRHGHAVGDTVIAATGAVLRRILRAGEKACRVGGDEFAVICPESSLEVAMALAERLRLELAAEPLGPEGLKVSASFGVAERADAPTHELLALRADEALYRAKQLGRNQVWAAVA
ncbi:MAG: GGDEF domain-containing protein [Myxococcota bacterium]|nr:GGDEF domain-containing protein [Myxococcota bacterium]